MFPFGYHAITAQIELKVFVVGTHSMIPTAHYVHTQQIQTNVIGVILTENRVPNLRKLLHIVLNICIKIAFIT